MAWSSEIAPSASSADTFGCVAVAVASDTRWRAVAGASPACQLNHCSTVRTPETAHAPLSITSTTRPTSCPWSTFNEPHNDASRLSASSMVISMPL